MNYIGSISILDRGDAPAQAVIDRNARSLAQRIADETKDELNKVMTRVHAIYSAMDTVDDFYFGHSMEFVNDLAELETILKDEIKKRQYQQQVTVFIVGYSDICHQKFRLLQQVNEFFKENSKNIDEEDWFPTTPDMDHDEVSSKVEDSLSYAQSLTKRLAELNKDMITYMTTMAEKKASHKRHPLEPKGRKKIEKALQQAKDDVSGLNEKLLVLQKELDDREDKVHIMMKQMDSKSLELQKFRTAAELAKQKLTQLQKDFDEQVKKNEEIKTDMTKYLDRQISALQATHRQEMQDFKQLVEAEAKKLQTASSTLSASDVSKSASGQRSPDPSAKQESNPEIKETKLANKTSEKKSGKPVGKSPTRNKGESKHSTKADKEVSDIAVQNVEGNPDTATVESQTKKLQAQPQQTNTDNEKLDLFNETLWKSLPADQVNNKFTQYRKLATEKIKDLEDQLELTLAKTKRKVTTLKAQFHEHKSKWEAERKLLIEQMDQSMKLQTDAEKEADAAMNQLEEYITEQEKLEEAEENQVHQIAGLLSPKDNVSSAGHSPVPSHPVQQQTTSPEPEQELLRLMQQTDDAKSTTSVEGVKVEGTTEEEIRASSAQSRASLRQQFKTKLGEAKQAAEDRRSKSPAIQLPTQLTIDDELILEDDDELDEGLLNEIGTSPPTGIKSSPGLSIVSTSDSKSPGVVDPSTIKRSPNQAFIQKIIRKGTSLLEHPLLKEFLKVFNGLMEFKDGVGKLLLDKDMMSAHQIIADLELVTFDQNKKVMPQVAELAENILYVLDEILSLMNSVLLVEREPPVSALNMSREQTIKSVPPPMETQFNSPTLEMMKEGVEAIRESSTVENEKLRELQEQYQQLKEDMEQERKIHQDQIQKNTVVMMELQETINDLQRELSSLGKAPLRTKSDLSSGRGTAVIHKSPSPESSVLFTRLDSERNAKIMRKAVIEDKLNPERYKEAIAKMDKYVSLPAQRLAHLVKKYVHHCRMKKIEENVKNGGELDDEVYEVLNKMENLQNQRAKKWAQKMDEMGSERISLANMLMETLDTIEQESGIFLIKPMYSYRGRETKPIYTSKLNRPSKIRRSLTPSKDPGTGSIPAPTPASQYRLVRPDRLYTQQVVNRHSMNELKFYKGSESPENGEVQITGNGLVVSQAAPNTMWNMQASHSWNLKEGPVNFLNCPRILEMDINRMLIGQNNISSKVPFPQSEDRLVNASQNTLRSYVTVNRPTAPIGGEWVEKRPSSGSASSQSSQKKVTVSDIDREIPAKLPVPQPLPPISPVPGQFDHQYRPVQESDDDEPPESPPGSSLYQSTNGRNTRHSASRLDQYMSIHSDTEDER
ncbi:golgin subfamily A member 3-like isoform X5 [Biomphalaria glabrata]|uniref:Golgin subfamily A member 3-like isoform X5 n=1 Tax=Biomphalaria glabrata TaxID=6526 RepID=A0A9W2ZCC1_BIOGL|nr:golgin subfamily A member 3-like isoform X5 [Biomphalaria glabrata]